MKIAFDVNTDIGFCGIDTYSRSLINALSEFYPQDEFTLCTNSLMKSKIASEFAAPNNNVKSVLESKANRNKFGLAMVKIKNNRIFRNIESEFDLIHQTNQFFLIKGIKNLVTTVHDLIPLDAKLYNQKEFAAKNYTKKVNYIFQNARVVIVPCQFVKDQILEYFPHYFSKRADDICVTYEGVPEHFQPTELTDELRKKVKLPENCSYFFFVGNLSSRKNLQRCINAYAGLSSAVQEEYKFLCVIGKHDNPENLISNLNESTAKNIIFAHSISDDELVKLYSGAAALVFPSLAEGFGLPVLEAQKCGCPVITSNLTSLPEVAGNGALLVDPYSGDEILQAMQNIATDSELREKLKLFGFENAAGFTWKNAAEKTMAAYERACSK